jgi:hypothetical protein
VCGCSLAVIAGSNSDDGVDDCECCVLSGRGFCVGLITRTEEAYLPWCAQGMLTESSIMGSHLQGSV